MLASYLSTAQIFIAYGMKRRRGKAGHEAMTMSLCHVLNKQKDWLSLHIAPSLLGSATSDLCPYLSGLLL